MRQVLLPYCRKSALAWRRRYVASHEVEGTRADILLAIGPFAGNIVTQAAFTFIYRFMSNKSAEYPEGRLNKDVLKSFMSVQGPENNLRWVPGNERIPNNWFVT